MESNNGSTGISGCSLFLDICTDVKFARDPTRNASTRDILLFPTASLFPIIKNINYYEKYVNSLSRYARTVDLALDNFTSIRFPFSRSATKNNSRLKNFIRAERSDEISTSGYFSTRATHVYVYRD